MSYYKAKAQTSQAIYKERALMLSFWKKKGPFANGPDFTWRFLVFFLFGILFFVGLWVAWPTLLTEMESLLEEARQSAWRERILEFGLLAPLVSVGIITAQVFPLPIPGPTIPIINGWLYGLWGGAALTWVGLMLKGVVGYTFGLGGRKVTQGNPLIERLTPYLERYGWRVVLITRMVPFFPLTPVSATAALIGMPWHTYLLASGLGVLPLSLLYAFIGTLLN